MTIGQYRTPPNYVEPIVEGTNTSQSYYRFFQAVDQGIPPALETAVTVGGSPFTYTAQHGGFMIITGGMVSDVSFVRGTSYTTGQTAGVFPLSFGDQLVVTYSGAPTMTFVPT